jgi:maltose alpha-D-glucosyltransferase/alpha-amylase
MNVLGRRLGELHLALASRPDIPAFAPEPITPDDLKRWTERLAGAVERALDRLKKGRRKLDPRAQELADSLLDQRDTLLKQVRKLLPAKVDADRIRHHGDFHLGQTLIVKDDAFIIDFEGEPQRSEKERQSKAPSARDAAGLIRSLDYAATTALQAAGQTTPEEAARMAHAIEQWRVHSETAFLTGLREVTGASRLWPNDSETAQRLLRFFVAEKAIYEIEYELANRPEWVAVPLSGVMRAILTDGKASA